MEQKTANIENKTSTKKLIFMADCKGGEFSNFCLMVERIAKKHPDAPVTLFQELIKEDSRINHQEDIGEIEFF